MSTACHAIHDAAAFANPNVVKVVLDAKGYALYFSRAGIPFPRQGTPAMHRHIGIYGYRRAALAAFTAAPPSPLEQREKLEQLRALELGLSIWAAVAEAAPISVDTPADLEAARRHAKEHR